MTERDEQAKHVTPDHVSGIDNMIGFKPFLCVQDMIGFKP